MSSDGPAPVPRHLLKLIEAKSVKFGDALSSVLAQWQQDQQPTLDPALARPEEPLIRAALEYVVPVGSATEPDAVVKAALNYSDPVTLNGQRLLRLRDDARAAVLIAAAGTEELVRQLRSAEGNDKALLASTPPDDGLSGDLTSAWIRAFVAGCAPDVEGVVRAQMRAAAAAAIALAHYREMDGRIPSQEKVLSHLALAELREPLELLIDRQDDGTDRFVGRAQEIRRLREFVDILDSESFLETVSRVVTRGKNKVGNLLGSERARGLAVVAGGGLGKSSLVAKFALDHLLKPDRPLPFVYLDFDRASLQPRGSDQLVIEAARQLALEFPDHADALTKVRQDLRDRLAARDSAVPVVSVRRSDASSAADPVQDFRDIFSNISQEVGVGLIVLDTLEVIQSDPLAVSGVCTFLSRLCEAPFGMLRVVAAGRAEMAELRDIPGLEIERKPLQLGALTVADANLMVERLGHTLMGDKWDDAWTRRLVEGLSTNPIGREPLCLRVCVESVRDCAPDDRDEHVRLIVREGVASNGDFVARLYLRRVVDHVRDPDVRRLAWPGLVARRIDRALLHNVIAPEAKLKSEDADLAFDKLASQVWIVLRDGDALVHQPDLRARTLPLMRRHDPATFIRLSTALRDWFDRRGDLTEAAYYRLLSGENVESVLADLSPEDIDRLAPAARDFAAGWASSELPDTATTTAYLRSRGGTLLSTAEFSRLSPEFGFAHLARAGADLLDMDDAKIEPRLLVHYGRPVALNRLSDAERVARQTVLIKTGQWATIDWDSLLLPKDLRNLTALALFVARTGRSGGRGRDAQLRWASRLLDVPGGVSGSWRIQAALMPFLASCALEGAASAEDMRSWCEDLLARNLPMEIGSGRTDRAILRSALPAARKTFEQMVRLWAMGVLADKGAAGQTLSSREAWSLYRRLSGLHESYPGHQDLMMQLQDVIEDRRLLTENRDWRASSDCIAQFAGALLAEEDLRIFASDELREFFAARHEEWITPVGYGVRFAEIMTGGRLDLSRLLGPEPELRGERGLIRRSIVHNPADGIFIAKAADEGSALISLIDTAIAFVRNRPLMNDLSELSSALKKWDALQKKLCARGGHSNLSA